MAGDPDITNEARFDQLIPSYTLTPEMSQQIATAFEGLAKPNVTYEREDGPEPKVALAGSRALPPLKPGQESIDTTPMEHKRLYRALERYGAIELARLFESKEGQELAGRLLEVLSGQCNGILLKGMPQDPGIKSLVIFGLKSLLGDKGEYPLIDPADGFYPDKRPHLYLPEIISRHPEKKPNFHRDGNMRTHLHDPESSFLFMASAQYKPLSAPTLFKKADSPDEEAVGHCLQPDELIVCNNKTLKHSTGPVNPGERPTRRRLMRYTIEQTTGDYPMDHLVDVEYMRGVPDNPDELKQWLKSEISRLQRQASRASAAL